MIASGQRDGIVIILAVILLLLALLAVFMWVQSSRREPLPHSAPPARTEVRIVDSLSRSVILVRLPASHTLHFSRFVPLGSLLQPQT